MEIFTILLTEIKGNGVQAHNKLFDSYGESALKLRQRQNWFAEFRSGNYEIEIHHAQVDQSKSMTTKFEH